MTERPDCVPLTRVRRSARGYTGITTPCDNGNPSNIAYGGHTLAQCIASACAEVPDGYFLFSAVGTFLSAVTQAVPLHFQVDAIRSTKTFRTIRVEAYQETSPGKERMVMFCLCDFQAKEKDIMFDHSPQPWHDYSPPERLPHLNDLVDQKLKSGELTPEVAEAIRRQNPLVHLNDFRLCPESMAAQKWIGVTPEVRTTQDHLPMHQRSSAVWLKTWYPITNHADQVATIGFLTDNITSILPLVFSGQNMSHTSACSSLQFSLQFLTEDPRVDEWALMEQTTPATGASRVFTEGRLFNRQGKLMAVMFQQGILRAAKAKL